MRKIISYILMCTLLIIPVNFYKANAEKSVYAEFYVNANTGNDNNAGTLAAPFKTIQRAQEAVREKKSGMTGDVVVNIASGRYEIDHLLQFDINDCGTDSHKVIYRGDLKNMPVISGAKEISGFVKGENGIWHTNVDVDNIRGLSINGVMAERAGTENKIYGTGHYNPVTNSSGIVTSADGIYVNKSDLPVFNNPSDVELFWDVAHLMIMMHAEDIIDDPENENQVIVKFNKHVWDSIFNRDNDIFSAPGSSGWDIAFSVENAYELLDEPGEFYYDRSVKTLYYMPRDGEDMNNAEVLCPMIDKLVDVKGRGYGNELKNLSFENITFAHTSWLDLNENSLAFWQAERPVTTFGQRYTSPAAFDVSWTDGLTIKNCHFYGIETAAIYFREGVKNSFIKGNTFNDIGCGAIIIGDEFQKEFTDSTTTTTGAANVFYKKGWTMSYQPKYGVKYLNLSVSGGDGYFAGNILTNDAELKVNPEAKSWLRADLGKRYDISEIRISFVNKDLEITSEMKSNIEVLVSNDRDFSNYRLVKAYGINSSSYLYLDDKTTEKYRYVMIRKTKADKFGISCLWIFSNDEDKVGNANQGLCINNEISNNCITRIGQVHKGAPAITAYYTDSLKIDHNEITEVPYSGMNVGWGWDADNSTAKNNTISNNYISDYMLQCNDGGGIYVHGLNPGSEIYGNYIKNGTNGYGGLYTDGGAREFTLYNNVMENTSSPIFTAVSSIKNIKAYNNYATSGSALNKGTNCDIEEVIPILPNNLPSKAAEIVFNAGLEEEYATIKDRIPKNDNNFFKGVYGTYGNGRKSHRMYSDFTNSYDSEIYLGAYLNNLSKNGFFGDMPWQYNPKYKFESAILIDRTDDKYNEKLKRLFLKEYNYKIDTSGNGYSQKGSHIDEMYMMRYLVDESRKSITHLSIDEMKKIALELIASATEGKEFGKYQSGAIAELQNVINSADSMNQSTELEKYLVVNTLENAVNNFMSKQYTDEVLYAFIKGAETEIDKSKKEVKITVPYGMNIDGIIPEFLGIGNTEISVDGELSLDTPVTLVSSNSDIGATSNDWKLIVTYEDVVSKATSAITASESHWYNSNDNIVFENRNDYLSLHPWVYPYMYKEPVTGDLKVRVRVDRPDAEKGISFIVSSKAGRNLEYDGNEYKDTYYMISLKNQTMELYRVQSGSPILVTSVNDVGFEYGMFNLLTFNVSSADNMDKVTVKIGSSIVLNNVEAGNIGNSGYFGILSKSVKVDVIDMTAREITGNLIPNTNLKIYGGNTAVNQKEWLGKSDINNECSKNIIDGNDNTSFTAKSDSMFIIDLGGQYTISDVRLKLGDAYSDRLDAYSGTEVYLTNVIPEEIDKTDITGLILFEDAEKKEIRRISPLAGETLYGNILYPMENCLSKTEKYRYVVVMKNNGYTDIADIDIYTYDETLQPASELGNVAPNSELVAKTSYGNKFGIQTYNLIEENAIDGDDNTHYLSYSESMKDSYSPERFILDLGKAVPVHFVRYISNAGEGRASNFTISVANLGDFSDRKTLLTVEGENNAEHSNKLLAVNGKYRYVLVEGMTAEQDISVSEIEVYAEPVLKNKIFEISSEHPAEFYASAGGVVTTPSDLTSVANNKIYMSQTGLANNGYGSYILIDLGSEYHIDSFGIITSFLYSGAWQGTAETSVKENFRANYKFFGLNEAEMKLLNISSSDSEYSKFLKYIASFKNNIISEEIPDILAGTLDNKSSGLCTFDVNEQNKNKKFRYVGVLKMPNTNDEGTKISDGQLCLSQIRVFAQKNEYDDVFSQAKIKLSADSTATINTTGIASKQAGSYKLITAFYDNDVLISTEIEDMDIAIPNKGYEFSYSYSIPDNTKKIRTFIFKNFYSVEPIQKCDEMALSAS